MDYHSKNAGGLASKGFEAELEGLILPGLELDLSFWLYACKIYQRQTFANGAEVNLGWETPGLYT